MGSHPSWVLVVPLPGEELSVISRRPPFTPHLPQSQGQGEGISCQDIRTLILL